MPKTSRLVSYFARIKFVASFRSFICIAACLALSTSLCVILSISRYPPSNLDHHESLKLPTSLSNSHEDGKLMFVYNSAQNPFRNPAKFGSLEQTGRVNIDSPEISSRLFSSNDSYPKDEEQKKCGHVIDCSGISVRKEVFHDKDIFLDDYKEMKKRFKIYVYPHKQNDQFADSLLPSKSKPKGNYASEAYFKQALMKSLFITEDPEKADLFSLPFSIASLRNDPRIGVKGIQDFIRDYISNVAMQYNYWNRTGGADHFYVACHSIGRSAMLKTPLVTFNAIQVVCSSSYFLSGYLPHKDACMPQIWPRDGNPDVASSVRQRLAFFAGSDNSRDRKKLIQTWNNDTYIFASFGILKTSYEEALLGSKFCLHVKGFEVNTARVADSIYYGCVPVIIADHYDLPFADILDWKSFSVVVSSVDIPLLKKILQEISHDKYLVLQRNVLKVRKHFIWHVPPVDYDAFYMAMYELWLRRNSIRIN